MPEEQLKTVIGKQIKGISKLLEKENISLKQALESSWDRVYEVAAKDFEVSPEVVQRRVDYDKLQQYYMGE